MDQLSLPAVWLQGNGSWTGIGKLMMYLLKTESWLVQGKILSSKWTFAGNHGFLSVNSTRMQIRDPQFCPPWPWSTSRELCKIFFCLTAGTISTLLLIYEFCQFLSHHLLQMFNFYSPLPPPSTKSLMWGDVRIWSLTKKWFSKCHSFYQKHIPGSRLLCTRYIDCSL